MDANQFRHRMSQLPRPDTTLKPPFWEAWRLNLYDWVLKNDPAEFWKCPAVYHTMCQAHWPISIEYEYMRLDMRLSSVCQIPHFGPNDYLGLASHSMNLIHQAYHIQQWEQATGRNINQLDTIVEFGGGYGAMALLCHRLGFEGKYIIYDLPEFSLLQEYYLSQFGLLASVEWNPKRKPKDVDLFMALYSLSEVKRHERAYLIHKAKSYLCLYSGLWEKWDNVHWFQTVLPVMFPSLQWQHTELTHLPDQNNHYSIGF